MPIFNGSARKAKRLSSDKTFQPALQREFCGALSGLEVSSEFFGLLLFRFSLCRDAFYPLLFFSDLLVVIGLG